jgi:serine/threonine-protein kinase
VSERAPPPEPLPEGTRLDDKYVIVRHIKTGGMGAVYEVEHTGLGKKLAAKLLLPDLSRRPELLERFRREARAASATGHENIVEVTDLGATKGGVPFLVMELLQGRTLGAELKNGRLPPERAVHITRQMLSALKAAHNRGIVHRDLKPENIFLIQRASDPDFVKVLDFGIAKLLTEEVGEELTRAGQVVGTPTYMAPEQARGAEIDARADLYAVGAILYRMVTGNRPFTAPSSCLRSRRGTPRRCVRWCRRSRRRSSRRFSGRCRSIRGRASSRPTTSTRRSPKRTAPSRSCPHRSTSPPGTRTPSPSGRSARRP